MNFKNYIKKVYALSILIAVHTSQSFASPIPQKGNHKTVNQMEIQTEKNKAVVRRFNKEVIEEGNVKSFEELMDTRFVNHSAPVGADSGPQGMINTFNKILRPAMPDLKVTIYEQVAEGNLVTTRKNISGTQTGTLMGVPPTGKKVSIDVIDIVKVEGGKYMEHWGINTLPVVLAQLKSGN
jgi:predicted ester cyclase